MSGETPKSVLELDDTALYEPSRLLVSSVICQLTFSHGVVDWSQEIRAKRITAVTYK